MSGIPPVKGGMATLFVAMGCSQNPDMATNNVAMPPLFVVSRMTEHERMGTIHRIGMLWF